MIQITRALKHLHGLETVHRDLKCANVFLMKDGTVKLGDLNVSKVCRSEGLMFTQTGTPYYASPEVWKDKPYDAKSDIWSLGWVLYEITSLNPPFRAKDMKALYKKVVKGQYSEIPFHYSKELRNVIAMCLKVWPTARPSAEQLLNSKEMQKRSKYYEDEIENDENVNTDNCQSILLKTIKITDKIKNIKLPKSKYNSSKSGKRSHSYEHAKKSKFSLHSKELIIERKSTLLTVESNKRIKTNRLNLLKK